MAETLEGLLYSTRRMGEAILNSIGALDAADNEEAVQGADTDGENGESVDTEADPGEAQPEGEATPVEEDSAEEEAPVTAVSVTEALEPEAMLPAGYYAVGIDGRTQDGSVPFDILKKQLERMR